jgi:hypothetical protein
MEVKMKDGTEISIRKNVDIDKMEESTTYEQFSMDEHEYIPERGKRPVVRQITQNENGSRYYFIAKE